MLPAVGPAEEVCADCIAHAGLCNRHEKHVLPQLAENVGWLKLMGEAHVEQKRRQSRKTLAVSPESEAHAERKRQARRSKRGIRGFLQALKAA